MRKFGRIFFVSLCLSTPALFVLSESVLSSNSVFSWKCENNTCNKEFVKDQSDASITSFKACRLLCGQSIIWPQPTKFSWNGPAIPIKSILVELSPEDTVLTEKLQHLIEAAKDVFWERILSEKQNVLTFNEENAYTLQVKLEITDLFHHSLTLSTDESYTLTIEKLNDMMQASIKGETFFGVRHGLETLAQLIVYDNVRGTLIVPSKVSINDKPKYPYRGLMLDTSRNYISTESIKNTINIMAANKLNSFHWHITDSQSFPLMLNGLQQFAEYGAYSPEKIYTEKDVKEIVNYASIRGIRVVPELDAPAHVGEGWQWAPSGTILCLAKEPWRSYCSEPPCGQLNPLSQYTYDILGELYMDYTRLFQPDIFHMGGDEVHFGCWDTSEDIKKWITENNSFNGNTGQNNVTDTNGYQNHKDTNTSRKGYFALWNVFQEKALKKLKEANKDRNNQPEVVLWTSDLTKGENLNFLNNTDYIIQVWTTQNDHVFNELLDKNFRIIISNYDRLYLNSGFGSWVSDYDDSIYRAWHSIYDNIPPVINTLAEEKKKLILGQEVALWTETCSEGSLDATLWPRAAALAERTWSDPENYWRNAESRMLYHRDRLVKLGAKADAIEPEWCNINRGGCS